MTGDEKQAIGRANKGRVIWITGFSGAGKTTLAKALIPCLSSSTILLDGDEMREALSSLQGGFNSESRLALAKTYAKLCGLLAGQGFTVVCATISMFHEVRAWNRGHLPHYIEVFLDVPESVRRERDPKKLYQKGILHMSGVDLTAELPQDPDIVFDYDPKRPVEKMVEKILQFLMPE